MSLEATLHSGRSKQARKESDDFISNLPLDVTKHILECLPFDHAVRTSILSTQWRYYWNMVPQLILDQNFFDAVLKRFKKGSFEASRAFSHIVNSILLCHIGPIDNFVLHIPSWVPMNADISQWILFVSRSGIKKITLQVVNQGLKGKLPSCLFSSVNLTHLELINWQILYLPPTFKGFPRLTSLHLKRANNCMSWRSNPACAKVMENLISLCPRLQYLNLFVIGATNLTICAPKLQHLVVMGVLNSISLKTTTNIKSLKLMVLGIQDCELRREMREFFSCLLSCEKLVLDRMLYRLPPGATNHEHKPFCEIEPPEKLGKELGCLETLELEVPLNCNFSVGFALCLFRSSPHLQQLHIKASACTNCHEKGKMVQINGSCTLQCLKIVDFTLMRSRELQLIKFLLACSPALEVLNIVFNENSTAEEKLEVAKKLMRYGRASPNVEIILKP